MGITKYNKADALFTNNERYDVYKTLEQLFTENGKDATYGVKGVFSYESQYGEGCFIKSDGFNVPLPNHLVKTIADIKADKESVDEINDGKVGFNIYSYVMPEKYPDKTFYSVNFVEM